MHNITNITQFFSHFWATRTQIRRQTPWQLNCTKKTAANTRNGWRRAWNRASSISWIEPVCVWTFYDVIMIPIWEIFGWNFISFSSSSVFLTNSCTISIISFALHCRDVLLNRLCLINYPPHDFRPFAEEMRKIEKIEVDLKVLRNENSSEKQTFFLINLQ